jgi:NADP-dependent 3-hydroxy acid dehydrogenase YdfG
MILITGASSGIGEACAYAFARSKNDLWLIARRKERLEALKKKLEREAQVRVRIDTLDITDQEATQTVFENAPELSDVSVLINNAGLATHASPIQETTYLDNQRMIDTNVSALLHITQRALPALIKNRGFIVNLGSIAGRWFYPKGNIYCMTKAAIGAFTETLRLDLLGTGVRVCTIAPGLVETEFSEVRLKDKALAKKVYEGVSCLHAEDIARAIHFVVSQPPHVNIQELVIYPTDQAAPGQLIRKTKT